MPRNQARSDGAATGPVKRPVATTRLFFKPEGALRHVDDPLHLDISAVAVAGRTVFAACDETATVERLVLDADGNFQHEENIALGDYFDLPDGPAGEMDIEGLAIDGDELWITGSHSLKRNKPDLPATDHDAAMATLAEIERDPNRCFLGRLKLVDAGEGRHVVDAAAVARGEEAAPSAVKMGSKGRNKLKKRLERDVHLAAAIGMPCKENGFDIEGIAVKHDRVFLGLRGPVLRGWSVILELSLLRSKPGSVKLGRCNDAGDRYLKHFLPLGGLGIRDLRFDGDDLLILAGPTMDHDGTGALFRWRRPLGADGHRLHPEDDLERLLDLPYDRGRDQAEGVAFVEIGGKRRLLVVHDSPSPARLDRERQGLVADLYELDG
jgi:hypothetical protein